mgnify:FL=1
MKDIREGVRAYLERESGIHAVCAPAMHAGEYPLLTVDAREDGVVLCAGGRQAEHRYRVSVTCASDRERSDKNAALSALADLLLRGIPVTLGEGAGAQRRVLSPRELETEGDTLRFALALTRVVPPEADSGGAETMRVLHWSSKETN